MNLSLIPPLLPKYSPFIQNTPLLHTQNSVNTEPLCHPDVVVGTPKKSPPVTKLFLKINCQIDLRILKKSLGPKNYFF